MADESYEARAEIDGEEVVIATGRYRADATAEGRRAALERRLTIFEVWCVPTDGREPSRERIVTL